MRSSRRSTPARRSSPRRGAGCRRSSKPTPHVPPPAPELALRREAVRRLLERTAGHPLQRRAALLAFVLPRYGVRLTRRLWRGGDPASAANSVIDDALGTLPEFIRRELGFDWRLDERRGYDEAGRLILTDVPLNVAQQSEYRFDEARGEWVDGAGERVFHGPCDHLREAIAEDFGIAISDPDWQHWNGGVFLSKPAPIPRRPRSSTPGTSSRWRASTCRAGRRATRGRSSPPPGSTASRIRRRCPRSSISSPTTTSPASTSMPSAASASTAGPVS